MQHPHVVNIHEAKTHFSKLVQSVLDGEEVIIAKAGHPVVKMTAILPQKKKIVFGGLKGQINIPDDFDAPLSDDLLDLFERKNEDTH